MLILKAGRPVRVERQGAGVMMQARIRALFRYRRHYLRHAVLYTFINGAILVAWSDPQRVNLDGGPGLLLLTLLWTPLFIIHTLQFILREWEHRVIGMIDPSNTASAVFEFPNYKAKRGEQPAALANGKIVQVGAFMLYCHKRRLSTPHKGELRLTQIEAKLIALLMQFPNQTLSIAHINQAVWGYETDDSTALKNTIYRLRKKVELAPNEPAYLIHVPDEGYAFMYP
jgi:DNA-binding response OmpR family regulator